MRRLVRLMTLLLAISTAAAWAVPVPFDLDLHVPPVISDSKAPVACTITYLIADLANNDLFAARMRIEAANDDTPTDNRMPCPRSIPPRVGLSALNVCMSRAGQFKSCVFADMGRGFQHHPNINNTAENYSRCASDQAADIGVACLQIGGMQVCSVGCGNSPRQAIAAAQSRCQDKQRQSCPITATVPVSGP